MNRDDIIRMAQVAGFTVYEGTDVAPVVLRFAELVAANDTALLRQALDCLDNHVMQRTYAGGVVICNTAIALRARLEGKQ